MKIISSSQTYELLTPAWAGSATPELSAEIRVPTLRGHLRQWLRLLHPGQHMDEAIFGSVNGNQAKSSRVQLRLERAVDSDKTQDLAAYTGITGQGAVQHPEGYFLWPLRTQKRGVILPGDKSKFTLEIRWFPFPGNPSETHQKAFNNALKAFSILGAIGTRATRGYGSIRNTAHNFSSASELSSELSFLPDSITVRLLNGTYQDGRKALAVAAKWMRSFRIGSDNYGASTSEGRNDHDVADPAQARRIDAVVYRQALGMPLAQRFRRGEQISTVQSKYRLAPNAPEDDRYPSPVRIKVIKLGQDYRILILILRDLLLPVGTMIQLSNNRRATLSHQLINVISNEGEGIH